jgi:hypothetical protein
MATNLPNAPFRWDTPESGAGRGYGRRHICATEASASGYGYDDYGAYYNWYDTPNGGFGYDSNGNYYNWYSTFNGAGYSYDSRGGYYGY